MIEVKNLSFAYSKLDPAVEDISFIIKDHEWISIVGHNGSGKSTISKLLVGLLKANRGEIIIDDVELTEETVDQIRQKIGIVFQNPDNQFVGINVLYDIAFGLENRNTPREEMVRLIDTYSKKVGMHEYLDREPVNLSGGQKQRVAIARILVEETPVIVFDDSLSALDTKTDLMIRTALKSKNQNQTMIIITHRTTTAKEADKIIVLNEGKVEAIGKHEELANQPGLYQELWGIQGELEKEFNEIMKGGF